MTPKKLHDVQVSFSIHKISFVHSHAFYLRFVHGCVPTAEFGNCHRDQMANNTKNIFDLRPLWKKLADL